MKTLFLIPARGGSKGLPGKNILPLYNKPLIVHSIDFAKSVLADGEICVSTDDDEIMDVAAKTGLEIPFKRPARLATDEAGSYGVILHALEFYESKSVFFDNVVLLQPTSPFRRKQDMAAMFDLYSDEVDAVISVRRSKANPFFSLFFENAEGYLDKLEGNSAARRQDAPAFYNLNGSIYILNVNSIKKYDSISAFPKKVKYEMNELYSTDIDTQLDFDFCEFLVQHNKIVGK